MTDKQYYGPRSLPLELPMKPLPPRTQTPLKIRQRTKFFLQGPTLLGEDLKCLHSAFALSCRYERDAGLQSDSAADKPSHPAVRQMRKAINDTWTSQK